MFAVIVLSLLFAAFGLLLRWSSQGLKVAGNPLAERIDALLDRKSVV